MVNGNFEQLPAVESPPGNLGVKQIANAIEQYMPILEQISGRSRVQLTADFIKAAAQGKLEGFFGDFISGLGGGDQQQQQVRPSKIERNVKVFAVWAIALFFLVGFGALAMFALYRWIVMTI